jgi:outer membrane protein TolC
LIPHGVVRDILAFQELMPFQTAHAVIDELYAEHLDLLQEGVRSLEDSTGIELRVIPVGDDLAESLAGLGENVETVLLGETQRLTSENRRTIISEFTRRGVPVFGLDGYPDVELGALAAFLPDVDAMAVRRVAINLSQLIRGASTNDLATMLPVEASLFVNGRTAAAVGYSPTFEDRIYAEFLYPEALESPETPLTFAQALDEAEKGNTALTIKDAEVDRVLQEKQLARSPLLPQIGANGSYDAFEPGPLAGVLPDELGTVGATITQMIYDDRVVSDYRSSKRLYEGVRHDREAARLDVLADAGGTFLEYVLSRVFYRIEAANVDLTQDNLELAKLRYEAGYSGQDEVFRWEAELARRRSSLFRSQASVESQRITFNQVLGVEQNLRWQPEEIDVDPNVFYFLDGRLHTFFTNARHLEDLRQFMVEFAMENAPELMFIAKAIESESIQLGQRKRSFIIPTFSASFDYNYRFHQKPDIASELDNAFYGVRIQATYPIFNGAGRLYDKRRSQAIVEVLGREEQLTRELVERRARTAFRRVENSFPAIKFAQTEAENSDKNLVIVQEKYAEGIVNVTDLLEAQTQAFNSQQNAAAAVYAFLADLVNFQRAIAWFEDEKTPEEKEQLLERIQTAVTSP